MRIALIGYGKMGQRIHALAKNYSHSIDLVVIGKINADGAGITASKFENIDLAIEFGRAEGTLVNIEKLLELGIPVVVGTTGWITDETRAKVTELCEMHEGKVLYGSNFSLGVQLFLKLVARSAELFGNADIFDAAIHEVHHTQKADAPSGTAITAADTWIQYANSTKNRDHLIPAAEKPNPESLYVTSQRIKGVVGEHELRIRSDFDDIRISHSALSRDAFAAGSLQAATWLLNQESGFYLIEDVVENVLGRS